MKQLINFHAWESEQLLRLMKEKSDVMGYNIETFTVVVDAQGWALSQATSDAFTFIKGEVSPCLLAVMLIVFLGVVFDYNEVVVSAVEVVVSAVFCDIQRNNISEDLPGVVTVNNSNIRNNSRR